MRRRAEQVDETRQRIVEATVRLHGELGVAATTISGIAEEAGVTRVTVYRHFPDEVALLDACTAHWLSQQQLPDPDAWSGIDDPLERLRAGLSDLYRYYREGEQMLTGVYRDKPTMPEPARDGIDREDRHRRDVLVAAFDVRGPTRRRLRAVVGHAASFSTWRSLCVEHGLSNVAAVETMSTLVAQVAGVDDRG